MRKHLITAIAIMIMCVSYSEAAMNLSSTMFKQGFDDGVNWRKENRLFSPRCGEGIKTEADAEKHVGFICGWADVVSPKLPELLSGFFNQIKNDPPMIEGFINGFTYRARNTSLFFEFPSIKREISEEILVRFALGYLFGMEVVSTINYGGDLNETFINFNMLLQQDYALRVGYLKAMKSKGTNLWEATNFAFLPKEASDKPRDVQRAFQLGYISGWWFIGSSFQRRLNEVIRVRKLSEQYQEGWLAGYCLALRFHDGYSKNYLKWAKELAKKHPDFGAGFKSGYLFFNPKAQQKTEVSFLDKLYETGGLPVAGPDANPATIDISNVLFHYRIAAISAFYQNDQKPTKRMEELEKLYFDLVNRQLENGCTRAIYSLIQDGTAVKSDNGWVWENDNKNKRPEDRVLMRNLAKQSIVIMNSFLAHNPNADTLGLKKKIEVLKTF
ncbi:MAG: hypothetical protein HQM10_09290 [Candidatus Riflebacteria bacterium]|nr:hypothetical protein [Candidatus Riflebacteria bacterium]